MLNNPDQFELLLKIRQNSFLITIRYMFQHYRLDTRQDSLYIRYMFQHYRLDTRQDSLNIRFMFQHYRLDTRQDSLYSKNMFGPSGLNTIATLHIYTNIIQTIQSSISIGFWIKSIWDSFLNNLKVQINQSFPSANRKIYLESNDKAFKFNSGEEILETLFRKYFPFFSGSFQN